MPTPEIGTEFSEYFDKWQKEIEHKSYSLSSSSADYCNTDSYKNMIRMGKRALPHLMQKLDEGHFLLNDAVSQITRIDIRKLKQVSEYSFEQKISTLWIEWWKENHKKK